MAAENRCRRESFVAIDDKTARTMYAEQQVPQSCELFQTEEIYLFPEMDRTRIMEVHIIHEDANGARSDLGIASLDHMPPVGEPFTMDHHTYYTAKAYFGPDERGQYLLILDGEPKLTD
jgi:hypothetical protein